MLIVGAGPVGLMMALSLERYGIKARIIDKADARTEFSKAVVLWSRTLENLETLRVADRFVGAGNPVHKFSIFADGRSVTTLTFDELESAYPFGLCLPQSETERLLEEALDERGIKVERNTELTELSQTADVVRATLSSGELVETPFLIGCDGAHSTVRHSLHMTFEGDTLESNWHLADVHLDSPLPTDEAQLFWKDGVLAIFPMSGGRARLIVESSSPVEPTLEQIRGELRDRTGLDFTVRDAIWLSTFRINERQVKRYRAGRVLLAGDAAHVHSPAGGQGMNTGMQDAWNLAWKLALTVQGKGRMDPLLDSYDVERHEIGHGVVQNAGRMTRLATLHSHFAQQLRNRLIALVGHLEVLRKGFRNQLGELSVHYTRSPIIEDHAHQLGGLRPGHRVPDLWLDEKRLYDVIADPRHTLLVVSPRPGDRELMETIDRRHGSAIHVLATNGDASEGADSLHHHFGPHGPTLYLIRPDGYLGYRASPPDLAGLERYLDRFLT